MKKLCIILSILLGMPQAQAQLDLHAHLDMKPGMGPGLIGDFTSPIKVQQWDSRLKTKASMFSLTSDRAPQLIVMSLYGHPWLSRPFHFEFENNVKAALEQEYLNIVHFVTEHSKTWSIAKSAKEARDALQNKKHVIVLSIEGAFGAFETEEDYLKWIDERGVAIVTPFHLTEDRFGGTAFMHWKVAFFNTPLSFLESVFMTGGTCLRSFCKSPMGIKPDGRTLTQNLMTHKVWIDLSHANDMETSELLPEFKAHKLPILITHTGLREIYPAERAVSPGTIVYLSKNGGMIGLIPSDDFLLELAPGKSCYSGLEELKAEFQRVGNAVGFEKVTLGTDINAPLRGLSPSCNHASGGAIKSVLEQKGFFDYEDFTDLTAYLSPEPHWNEQVLDEFLKNWERVRP